MSGPKTQLSLDRVAEHGITPARCDNCGSRGNWSTPTIDGTTAATDDGAVIWRCQSCNHITAMRAEAIRSAARRAAQREGS